MMHVVLAGNYPAHTYEKLRALLPETEFDLTAVDTPEAYEAMTDAEIIILRIFKAPQRSHRAESPPENDPALGSRL